ncbi:DUF2935 domain-containing protein [Bacillus badius]|uniref:DUF2935 domain-containing protein n=1 Tax=Bacillus badius TaxID=1455 RepID=UPI002E1C331C|nr:DUF2935 domain-containing protein [Bacillus badius]
MIKTYEETAKFEHEFWLQILGDHSRFIYEALAPNEQQDVEQSRRFIQAFDRLLEQARKGTTNWLALSRLANEETEKLRMFKLDLIRRHLTGKVSIQLGPTFISHMVNELDEYKRLLKHLQAEEVPPVYHALHHHLLWLLDAAGHAGAISDRMDRIEKRLKQKSDRFTKDFEAFYLKAVEMTGFLRANLSTFPALERFNQDTSLEMKLFMNFLQEIEELELSKEALGTFAPLMADHMMREECYYLIKLAESTGLQKPSCDPTKPRIDE